MKLCKYYLDAVDADGAGCLCYAASIDGFGLRATAAGILDWDSGPEALPRQRRTLRGQLPHMDGKGAQWNCRALSIEGGWQGTLHSVAEEVLWKGNGGSVRWCALAPCAQASVRLGTKLVRGLGYVERLELDVRPWELPIDTLRWGRFAAEGQSAIWIEWEQEGRQRWLWHNGEPFRIKRLNERELAWADWTLELEAGKPLRVGKLSDTVLARWPGLGTLLPPQLRGLDEAKFLSRARLAKAGRSVASGFSIHEHVRFR